MFKKFLSLALIALMLTLFCACNSSGDTEQTSGDTDKPTEEVTNAPTDAPVNNGDVNVAPDGAVQLSGSNRFKVVYAPGAKKMGLKIQDELIALDPLSSTEIGYYKLLADETNAADGTPEILVGITNRAESISSAAELPTYLDYAIYRIGNNIAIIANTPERLEEAVDKFISLIEVRTEADSKQLFYTGGEVLLDSYTDYSIADLKLGDTPIHEFSVVISANASELDKSIAENLLGWFRTVSGAQPALTTDAAAEEEFEILIGSTARDATADLANGSTVLGDAHYCLRMKDGKLVLAAADERGYARALAELRSMITENEGVLPNGTDILDTEAIRSLDGKNILFVGNSFVYYGRCIVEGDQKNVDKGYLYEICKRNGDDVNVYDYVWGGKDLKWIYDNHLSTADPEFLASIDIVFMSEAGNNNGGLISDIEEIQSLFPATTEFYYMSHSYVYQANSDKIIAALPKLVERGIPVGDWGAIVYDLWTGALKFPESEISYNKQTFVKNKGDTFHQNMLSGYITAQMAYCLATGKSAVGQDYSFCCDPSVNPAFDADAFIADHYEEGTTNMDKVFASRYDMLEIQKLIDAYIDRYNYSY